MRIKFNIHKTSIYGMRIKINDHKVEKKISTRKSVNAMTLVILTI